MATRTFRAASLPEAMAEVRAELGADAVIQSWSRVAGGIELIVTTKAARAEPPAPPASAPVSPADADFQAWNAGIKRPSRAPRRDVFEGAAQPRPTLPPDRAAPGLMKLVRKPAAPATVAGAPPAPTAVQAASSAPAPSGQPAMDTLVTAAPHAPRALERLLLHAGATPAQLAGLTLDGADGGLQRALVDLLSDQLRFAPLDPVPATPLLLAGPPGSGKTASCAKLAARALAAGASVVLASCDTGRSGGPGQLQALAERLGAGFATADSARALEAIAQEAAAAEALLLVDSPAASHLQPRDLALVAGLAEAARAEPLLCLPADARPDDAADLVQASAEAGLTRALLTRLDLTTRPAGVLLALGGGHKALLGLCLVSDTPFIAGGLAPATPARLARLLIEGRQD
jgi:flagellar biosynthesis protein FlhF